MTYHLKAKVLTAFMITGLCIPNAIAKPAATAQSHKPTIDRAKIETTSEAAINAFHTPGIAVGIVQGGEIKFVGGFGKRNIKTGQAVDGKTLFRIASTTKAFTSAALAILVDEGVLHWDDPVIDTIPEFRMFDPWVTREFTIRDLLTHRSGLGLGAGDLMLWPEPSGFSRAEIIHNLRYLKPVSSFRSKYAYDNLLYIVAGEVVARASGKSYEDFVQSRILDPLNMPCFAGEVPKHKLKNAAIPYGYTDNKTTAVTRNQITGRITASQAAGGLVCNAKGMTIWMQTLLADGVGPNGKRIFSKKQRDEMWKSQTILRVSSSERKYDNTHFKTYALGWRKDDVHGYEVISHTGTLSGFQAYISLVPELDLGVVVLNNGSNYGARTSVMQTLIKSYMGQPAKDWVKIYKERQEKAAAHKKPSAANDNWQGSGKVLKPLDAYQGSYQDNWFGKVDIYRSGAILRFRAHKSVNLKGRLEPFDQNTFIVRWDNRGFGADAYARFETNFKGEISGLTMRHVDPDADFSFDFQDLDFTRLTPKK